MQMVSALQSPPPPSRLPLGPPMQTPKTAQVHVAISSSPVHRSSVIVHLGWSEPELHSLLLQRPARPPCPHRPLICRSFSQLIFACMYTYVTPFCGRPTQTASTRAPAASSSGIIRRQALSTFTLKQKTKKNYNNLGDRKLASCPPPPVETEAEEVDAAVGEAPAAPAVVGALPLRSTLGDFVGRAVSDEAFSSFLLLPLVDASRPLLPAPADVATCPPAPPAPPDP